MSYKQDLHHSVKFSADCLVAVEPPPVTCRTHYMQPANPCIEHGASPSRTSTLQDHVPWVRIARIPTAAFSIDKSASDARIPCTHFAVNKYLSTVGLLECPEGLGCHQSKLMSSAKSSERKEISKSSVDSGYRTAIQSGGSGR